MVMLLYGNFFNKTLQEWQKHKLIWLFCSMNHDIMIRKLVQISLVIRQVFSLIHTDKIDLRDSFSSQIWKCLCEFSVQCQKSRNVTGANYEGNLGSISNQHFTRAFFVQKQILQLFSNYRSTLWLFGKRILAKNACVKCRWNWPLINISDVWRYYATTLGVITVTHMLYSCIEFLKINHYFIRHDNWEQKLKPTWLTQIYLMHNTTNGYEGGL